MKKCHKKVGWKLSDDSEGVQAGGSWSCAACFLNSSQLFTVGSSAESLSMAVFFPYIYFHGSPRLNNDLHIITYTAAQSETKRTCLPLRPSKQIFRVQVQLKKGSASDVTGCLPSFSSCSVALGQMSLGSNLVLLTPITWKRNAMCL